MLYGSDEDTDMILPTFVSNQQRHRAETNIPSSPSTPEAIQNFEEDQIGKYGGVTQWRDSLLKRRKGLRKKERQRDRREEQGLPRNKAKKGKTINCEDSKESATPVAPPKNEDDDDYARTIRQQRLQLRLQRRLQPDKDDDDNATPKHEPRNPEDKQESATPAAPPNTDDVDNDNAMTATWSDNSDKDCLSGITGDIKSDSPSEAAANTDGDDNAPPTHEPTNPEDKHKSATPVAPPSTDDVIQGYIEAYRSNC